jgi:hypothetical protein
MTLAVTCKIVFHKTERRTDIILNHWNWWKHLEEMTDKGSLTTPHNVRYFDNTMCREVFRKWCRIQAFIFGYDGNNEKSLEGYIRAEVSADIQL